MQPSLAIQLGMNGAFACDGPAPEGAAVYFIEVKNGPKVTKPVVIKSQVERKFV